MSVETLKKECTQAIQHFENKLAFETGPIELSFAIKDKEPLQIVDLRAPEVFSKGHIPGAVNITLDELEKSLDRLSPETTTVVYCYNITCHLSTKAALLLARKGYKVKELFGGWEDWAARELPIEGKVQGASCAGTSASCAG